MERGKLIKVSQVTDGGLYILENKHEKSNLYPLHYHNVNKILYIAKGKGNLVLGKQFYPVRKNDFAIIRAGTGHQVMDDKKELIHMYGIYFTDSITRDKTENKLFHALLDSLDAENCIFSLEASPFLSRITFLFKEIIYEKNNHTEESALVQRVKLVEILILVRRFARHREEITRPSSPALSATEQKVMKIIHYLETNYYKHIFLEEVAAMVPVGKRQFDRIFQKLTNTTFTGYLNQVRINKAKEWLLAGKKEIITICFDTGFSDLSYFYRIFKRYTGMTPGEFIQEQRDRE